jgi:hypothetical protein
VSRTGKSLIVILCQPEYVTDDQRPREELEELVAQLREENARLREEIQRLARERHEVPPHYL